MGRWTSTTRNSPGRVGAGHAARFRSRRASAIPSPSTGPTWFNPVRPGRFTFQYRDARGKLEFETFREEDAAAAVDFLRLVEGCGGDWPSRWVKGQDFPTAVSGVTVRSAALMRMLAWSRMDDTALCK